MYMRHQKPRSPKGQCKCPGVNRSVLKHRILCVVKLRLFNMAIAKASWICGTFSTPFSFFSYCKCQKEKGPANQKLRMRRPTNQMADLLDMILLSHPVPGENSAPNHPLDTHF